MIYRVFSAIVASYLIYMVVDGIRAEKLVFEISNGLFETVDMAVSPTKYWLHIGLYIVGVLVLLYTVIFGAPKKNK